MIDMLRWHEVWMGRGNRNVVQSSIQSAGFDIRSHYLITPFLPLRVAAVINQLIRGKLT